MSHASDETIGNPNLHMLRNAPSSASFPQRTIPTKCSEFLRPVTLLMAQVERLQLDRIRESHFFDLAGKSAGLQ